MDLVSLPKEHRAKRCSLFDRKTWRQSGILEEHFNGGHNDHKNKVRIEAIASCLSADYFVSSPITSTFMHSQGLLGRHKNEHAKSLLPTE